MTKKSTGKAKGIFVAVKTLVGQGGGTIGVTDTGRKLTEYIGQPDEVKRLFMANATSLGRHEFFQGAGLVDLMRVLSNT